MLLTERVNLTYVQAFRVVRPSSTANDASAMVTVHRMKKWYHSKYPLGILDAFAKCGVTIERIVAAAAAGLDATLRHWDNKKGIYIESDFPDYKERRNAAQALMKIGNLDMKVRQELAVGKQEMQKMHLDTGPKHETMEEFTRRMEEEDEKLLAQRAQAAKDMKHISDGRAIIQEQGEETAERYRQIALGAAMSTNCVACGAAINAAPG